MFPQSHVNTFSTSKCTILTTKTYTGPFQSEGKPLHLNYNFGEVLRNFKRSAFHENVKIQIWRGRECGEMYDSHSQVHRGSHEQQTLLCWLSWSVYSLACHVTGVKTASNSYQKSTKQV